MQNRQVQNNQEMRDRVEHTVFFGIYVIFMIINIVFATTTSQNWTSLSAVAALCVAICLWYFPDN